MARYAEHILRYDARPQAEPFTVVAVEQRLKHGFRFGDREVVLAGVADRIDRMSSGALRIVDYKSGGDTPEFPSPESLFSNEAVNTRTGELRYEAHNGAVLQTLLYGLILNGMRPAARVQTELYVARRMGTVDFSPIPVCKDEAGAPVEIEALDEELRQKLLQGLEGIFTSLFDASVPFTQTEHHRTCEFCDFRPLCRR